MNSECESHNHMLETKIDHKLKEVIKSCKSCDYIQTSTLTGISHVLVGVGTES